MYGRPVRKEACIYQSKEKGSKECYAVKNRYLEDFFVLELGGNKDF
jgi:hypothetical protein